MEYFGCIDMVMHCSEGVEVTVGDVTFVPGVSSGIRVVRVLHEEHSISLGDTGAHMLDERVIFYTEKFGNKVETATARGTSRTCRSSFEAW